MNRFTDEEFLGALNGVVEVAGDAHVYEPDGDTDHMRRVKMGGDLHVATPYSYEGCIVGKVIQRLDPRYYHKLLDAEVEKGASFNIRTAPPKVREALRRRFTRPQLAALSEAQGWQDNGSNWGKARDVGIEMLEIQKRLGEKGV